MVRIKRLRAMGALFGLALLTVMPGIARADASAVLYAAYENMLNAKFSTTAVTTDAKGKQTHATTEFESIERMRIQTDSGGFVVLPEGVWMRSSASEPWTKPPIDMSGLLKQVLPRTLADMRAQTTNVRDEGERTVDGKRLRAISHDSDMKVMGISMSSSTTSFIDTDGRIVRTESTGTAMGRKSSTVQDIRYDDSIRITAPGS